MNCPEDPRKLAGQPIGMYHCPDCNCMQMAGLPHMCDTTPNGCEFPNCDDCITAARLLTDANLDQSKAPNSTSSR